MPSQRTSETTQSNGPSTDEWETINLGLGEAWDLERNGPLEGHFLGTTTTEITDRRTGEKRRTNVHQFAPRNDPEAVVFVWGGAQLDAAFASDLVRQGDLLRVTFLGIDQYTDKDTGEPRTVKRYRLQMGKREA